MTFKLSTYTLNEIGRRKNQEDILFPSHGKIVSDDRLFILCDGTGDKRGDKASKTVCETLSRYILQNSTPDGVFSDAVMHQAIASAYNALDNVGDVLDDGIGTTLAALKFHDGGATIAYVGSTRIYHVRPASRKTSAQLLFRSNTPEPGEPDVMMPRQRVRARVEIAHIQDIQPDDYFFICSDGMLEFLDDEKVLYHLTKPGCSDKDKANILLQVTLDNKDNHSAHLIHVQRVKGKMPTPGVPEPKKEIKNYVELVEEIIAQYHEFMQVFREKKLNTKGYTTLGVIIAFLLLILLWAVWPSSGRRHHEQRPTEVAVDSLRGGNADDTEEVSIADFGIDESDASDIFFDDVVERAPERKSEKKPEKKIEKPAEQSSEPKAEPKAEKPAEPKPAAEEAPAEPAPAPAPAEPAPAATPEE